MASVKTARFAKYLVIIVVVVVFVSPVLASDQSHSFSELPHQWKLTELMSLAPLKWQLENGNSSVKVRDAWVPSCVHTVLQRRRLITDPYLRDNDVQLQWIALQNWTYSVRFDRPSSLLSRDVVLLMAPGVDTVAEVQLNGHRVGTCSNAHRRHVFPVQKTWFREAGSFNELAFRFVSPVLHAAERASNYTRTYGYTVPIDCPSVIQHGQCHANFIRKAASSFSWDWGPGIPTTGISDDVLLVGFNGCLLMALNVVPVRCSNGTHWVLNADFETYCSTNRTVQLSLKIASIGKWTWTEQAIANHSTISKALLVPSDVIRLWWPNGYGKQNLYYATGSVSDENGEMSKRSVHFGFRTVRLVERPVSNDTAHGLTFYFEVNDIPVFLKGANWVPPDVLWDRVSRRRIWYLLFSMRHSFMNTVRVWGGGSYESDYFYWVADRLGIMVWQEFMFAVNLYPTDDEFLHNVHQEVIYQVTRLKSHPSVITWSGNNENEQGLNDNWFPGNGSSATYRNDYLLLYNVTIATTVREIDHQSRPFLLSSPSNGQETIKSGGISTTPNSDRFGDVHFYSYFGDSWQPSLYPVSRCVTEFGFQSLPSLEAFSEAGFEGNDLSYHSEQMLHRQHHAAGQEAMLHQVLSHFRPPSKISADQQIVGEHNSTLLRKLIYLTQLHQAVAYKTAVEHFRRWRSSLNDEHEGFTMCALYWQLNDVWQAPSWSSIEYPVKWKMLHYYSRHFFEPILVSPVIAERPASLSVFVVSDATTPVLNVSLEVQLRTWTTFEPVSVDRVNLKQIRPLSAEQVYNVSLKSALGKFKRHPAMAFFHVVLRYNFKTLSSNFLLVNELKEVPPEKFGRARLDSVFENGPRKFVVQLTCDRPAPFVWLDAGKISGHFSDNGFIMLKAIHRVLFTSWYNITIEELTASLSVMSLADVYLNA